jgi:hypothetical protein
MLILTSSHLSPGFPTETLNEFLSIKTRATCPAYLNLLDLIFLMILNETMGRDSSVGIATCYGLDGPGIESRWAQDFPQPVQTGPGAYPLSYAMGTGSLSWGQSVRGVALTTDPL